MYVTEQAIHPVCTKAARLNHRAAHNGVCLFTLFTVPVKPSPSGERTYKVYSGIAFFLR